MNSMDEEVDQFEQTEFNRYIFELEIDKETSKLAKLVIDMDLDVNMFGADTTITQTMESTFGKYNEVDDIKVPEEVMDNLEEADENTVNEILEGI